MGSSTRCSQDATAHTIKMKVCILTGNQHSYTGAWSSVRAIYSACMCMHMQLVDCDYIYEIGCMCIVFWTDCECKPRACTQLHKISSGLAPWRHTLTKILTDFGSIWLYSFCTQNGFCKLSQLYSIIILFDLFDADFLRFGFHWTFGPRAISSVLPAGTDHGRRVPHLRGTYQPLQLEVSVNDHAEWELNNSGKKNL